MLDRDQVPAGLLTELRQLKATQNNTEVQERLETIETILERLLGGQGQSQEELASDTRQSAKGPGEGTKASADQGNLRRRWHSFLHRSKRASPAQPPARPHSQQKNDFTSSGDSRPTHPSAQELAHEPTPRDPSPFSDTLVEVLREHQQATVSQLREMTGYMRGLNESLTRDVVDRQQELRGVTARIDQLRSEMGQHSGDASSTPHIHQLAAEGQVSSDRSPDADSFIGSTALPSMHHPVESYEPTVVTYTPSLGTPFPAAVQRSNQVSTSTISLPATGSPTTLGTSRISHSPATHSAPMSLSSTEQRNLTVQPPRSPTPPAHRQYISNMGPQDPVSSSVPLLTNTSLSTSATSPPPSSLSPSDGPDPLRFPGGQISQHAAAPRALNYQHSDPEHSQVNKSELEPGQVVGDAYDTQTRHHDEFGQTEQLHSPANEPRRSKGPVPRSDEFPDVPPLLGSFPPHRTQALEATIRSIQASLGNTESHPTPSVLDAADIFRELFGQEPPPPALQADRDFVGASNGRVQANRGREATIRGLEEELSSLVRNNGQQLYTNGPDDSRLTAADRHETLCSQLSDIANMVQKLYSEHEGRREEKQRRENERENQIQELLSIVARIVEEQAAARQREEEGSYALRSDTQRQYEELIHTIRATANEQVPYNVQGYLDEFSKVLASEIRMLLGEVGKLREERRSIQHELGLLLMIKSKYGPGGEFYPDWSPPMPPPAADQPDFRPGWRPILRRQGDDFNPDWESDMPSRPQPNGILSTSPSPSPPLPPPPEPAPESRYAQSWATWQPNPALAPTPPSIGPTLVVPDLPSPGLFGPRSPRSSVS